MFLFLKSNYFVKKNKVAPVEIKSIQSIQLLRAIAALVVVFYHYKIFNLEIGMFGVDIFFVISGFIIAYMVNQTTKLFMIKRIIRVAPLYFMATSLTISLFFIKPQWFNHVVVNTEAVIKSFLFIPYSIGGSGPILSLGWTLNFEMFFYLAMFACILVFKKREWLVPACAGLLILVLVVLNSIDSDYINAHSTMLRFYRNGLLPEFLYGLALYYFWNFYENNRIRAVDHLMILLGLAAFVFMVYCDATNDFESLSRNIRRGVPSVLFANAFLILERKINEKNWLIRFGLKLGDSSYAMYIFHPFIVLFLLRVVYPNTIGTSNIFIVELLKMVFTIGLVCFASILIFDFVDKPINLFFKRLLKIRRKVVLQAY